MTPSAKELVKNIQKHAAESHTPDVDTLFIIMNALAAMIDDLSDKVK